MHSKLLVMDEYENVSAGRKVIEAHSCPRANRPIETEIASEKAANALKQQVAYGCKLVADQEVFEGTRVSSYHRLLPLGELPFGLTL